jgi:hypothetical protein
VDDFNRTINTLSDQMPLHFTIDVGVAEDERFYSVLFNDADEVLGDEDDDVAEFDGACGWYVLGEAFKLSVALEAAAAKWAQLLDRHPELGELMSQ